MILVPPSFLRQEDKAVEFLSAVFQFLGGVFGLVGGFSASSLAYTPSRHAATPWVVLVFVMPMIGSYLLAVAYVLRTVAAANRDYAERMFNWETTGPCRDRRPQLRWFAFQPRNILWWGGLMLSLGAVVFCVGTTARLGGQFVVVNYTSVQSLILEKISPAVGGMLMLVGAGLHVAKEFGWMVSKGAMPPMNRKDAKSPKFWVNWTTLWGSLGYFYCNFLPIMYSSMLPRTVRLAKALGIGGGSLMLMAGGILIVFRMAAREDDPEVELHQKVEKDDEALSGKLLAMAEVLGHTRDKLSSQSDTPTGRR